MMRKPAWLFAGLLLSVGLAGCGETKPAATIAADGTLTNPQMQEMRDRMLKQTQHKPGRKTIKRAAIRH